MKSARKLSRRKELGVKVIYAALQILNERGGNAPIRELIPEVEKRVKLDDWAKEPLEKSGHVRWQAILNLFSIDYKKAGFLRKEQGVWYLTPKGQKALQLGEVGLFKAAIAEGF